MSHIPRNKVDLLSNLKFNSEGQVYVFMHLNQFDIARPNFKKKWDNDIYVDYFPSHWKDELSPSIEH